MSGKATYDVVVIGAGHNGLTTAALLARRGRRVLVVEAREKAGGLCATEEFHAGYRSPGVLHDATGVRRFAVKALGLERHGLEFEAAPPPVFTPQSNDRGLLLHHDPAAAAAEIAAFSERDAVQYGAYREFIDRVRGAVNGLLDGAPPDLTGARGRDGWKLMRTALGLRRLGRRDMTELLRIAPMSAADWLGEWFETDLLKASLAGPAVYGTFTGPRSPGSALNLLIWECRKAPPPKGGPAALVEALETAARGYGAEIRTGARAARIDVDGGAVRGVTLDGGEEIPAAVVAASCDPKRTFLDLVPPGAISNKLLERVRQFRARGTTAKANIALGAQLEMAGRGSDPVEVIRTGERLDDLERAFDAVKYGGFSETPVLDIYVPSFSRPEFAPPGHSSLSVLVHFAPADLAGGWSDESRKRLGGKIVEALARYWPALPGAVASIEILTPRDIEDRYGLSGGHVFHGEHAIDQLIVRPVPEAAAHATPIGGLFLCGGGSFPGGGITCAPGGLAAGAILQDS